MFHLHTEYFVPAVTHLFRRLPLTPIGQVLRGKSAQLQKAAGLVEVQEAVNTSGETPQIPVVDSHGKQAKIFISILLLSFYYVSYFVSIYDTNTHTYT